MTGVAVQLDPFQWALVDQPQGTLVSWETEGWNGGTNFDIGASIFLAEAPWTDQSQWTVIRGFGDPKIGQFLLPPGKFLAITNDVVTPSNLDGAQGFVWVKLTFQGDPIRTYGRPVGTDLLGDEGDFTPSRTDPANINWLESLESGILANGASHDGEGIGEGEFSVATPAWEYIDPNAGGPGATIRLRGFIESVEPDSEE
jgi:hypothetical protein